MHIDSFYPVWFIGWREVTSDCRKANHIAAIFGHVYYRIIKIAVRVSYGLYCFAEP